MQDTTDIERTSIPVGSVFSSLEKPTSALDGFVNEPAPSVNFNLQSADRTARLAAVVNAPTITDNSAVEKLHEVTEQYHDLISQYGDQQLRQQAAARQQENDVRATTDYLKSQNDLTDPDGTGRAGAIFAAQAAIAEDVSQREKYALEQEALKKIQDMAAIDPVQATVLANNYLKGDSNQIMMDFTTKQLILQREIENAGVDVEDQSIVADIADFIIGGIQNSIPFTRGDIGNIDIDASAKNWYDSLVAGTRKQNEAGSLWNLPAAQFADFVKDKLVPQITSNATFLGYKNNSDIQGYLAALARPVTRDQTDIVDTFNVAAFAEIPLKIATSIPRLLVKGGARTAAVAAVQDAAAQIIKEGAEVAAKKTGIPQEEVIRALSPTAIAPEGLPTSSVPIATDAAMALERGTALLNSIVNINQPGRFTSMDELQAVFEKNASRIVEQLEAKAWVKDINLETVKTAAGQELHNVVATIGQKSGGGFATLEEAEGFARSLGLPKGSAIEVPYPRAATTAEDDVAMAAMGWEGMADDSGQYFVRMTTPMRETGLYTSPLAPQPRNAITRYLLGARKISDTWLQDLAQVGSNTKQRITAALGSKLKSINSLNQGELSALGQVAQAGNNNMKWWSDAELKAIYQRSFDRQPTQKELTAYHDYVDLNDMEYALRNDAEWAQRHMKGYETVSIRTENAAAERANALVNRNAKEVPKERVWDATEGRHYTSDDPLTPEKLQELKDRGGVLITFENGIDLVDGTRVKNVIVHQRDLDVSPLRRDQLGYREGGHRIYDVNYLVKQARTFKQPDGVEQLVNPRTFIGGKLQSELREWAEKMEMARIAVRSGAGEEVLDKLFQGNRAFPTGREFMDDVKSGAINLNHPFEIVGDRELPSLYRESGKNLEFVDQDQTGINGLLESQGRLFYSRKGEHLRDFRGDLAPTFDAYETLNMSLQNITKLTSFADYKAASIERWASTFRKYTNLSDNSSDWEVFMNGQLNKDLPSHLMQGAEGQRDVIRRILGHQTPWDRSKDQIYRQFAEWVDGPGGSTPMRKMLSDARLKWWSKDARPADALRGLVFDKTMGFWNPVQVPLNLGSSYVALTIGGPKKGMNALINSWYLRSYLTDAGDEKWLSHFADQGVWKKTGFKDAEEFKTFMRHSKESGVMNVGDSNYLINKFGPSASISSMGNKVHQIRTSGRMLLHKTWQYNKMIAQSIAWQELRETMPNVSYKSKEFLNKLAGRTEELDMNFSKESQAAWQQGWTAIPTQFWSYWVNLADAVLGKQFSAAQKRRLVIGQVFLAGSAGMPFIGGLDNLYSQQTGDIPDPSTFWGGLRRGALDELIYLTTGADVEAGARIGSGNEAIDTVREIMGYSAYGETSLLDVFGGASYSVLKNAGKTVIDLVKHAAYESGGDTGVEVTRDTILGLASQINSVGNLTKAYSIFKYGTVKSASGRIVSQDAPTAEGFAQAIGFRPADAAYVGHLMAYQQNQKEPLKDAVNTIVKYRQRFASEPDNRDQIGREINTFVKLLPPEIRMKALRAANSRDNKALYQSLKEQIDKDKQKRQLIKQFNTEDK